MAAEESVFLTKYASHVTILIRGEDFSCAEAVAQAARNSSEDYCADKYPGAGGDGENALRSIRYQNTKTGEESVFAPEGDTFGVFVFAGYAPDTELVKGKIELDERGYVCTDRNRKTNLPGVYAAGDVCQKNLRQVVTAVGDGQRQQRNWKNMLPLCRRRREFVRSDPVKGQRTDRRAGGRKRKGGNSAGSGRAAKVGWLVSKGNAGAAFDSFTRMEAPLILSLHLDRKACISGTQNIIWRSWRNRRTSFR